MFDGVELWRQADIFSNDDTDSMIAKWDKLSGSDTDLVADEVSQALLESLAQVVGHICLRHRLLLATNQVFDGDSTGRHLCPA